MEKDFIPKDPMMEMGDKKTPDLDNKNKEKTFDKKELVEVGKLEESFESFLSIIDNKLEIVKWKDDIKYIKELRKDLVSIFNEIKETLVEIDNLEQLSQEDIDELILNVPAQTFRLNEIIKNNFIDRLQASDDGFIFDVKDVGEVVKAASDINQEIDKLDLPDYQNEYSFDNLNNSIKESTKPINYGEFVGGAAEKVKNKFVDIQEKVLNKLKSKINSEKVKNLIEKLQQSEALPKVAYGVTLFTMGVLVANPFSKLYGQVDMELEDGNLKMNVDGLEITTTNNIDELNYHYLDREIHGEQIDKVYDMEIELMGVDYKIEDEAAFDNFIDGEINRILPEIAKITHKTEINKERMRPNELILVSSKIVQDNMEYNYKMIEEGAYGMENKKINNMPLDELLMKNKNGVCRQYAAAVEAVSDRIKMIYNSPYLRNIKIEELPVNVDGRANHAMNIVIEKANEEKIVTSYIDATWDDDGKFNDNLSVKFNEDRRSTEGSFIESLGKEKNFFNSVDKEKIYQYIIDNYSINSPEKILASNLLIDQYKAEIDDTELKEIDSNIYKKLKDVILLQGFKNDGELLNRNSYESYINLYIKYLKNIVGPTDSFSERENLYKEAMEKYDKSHKENYYPDISELYIENGNYEKAKEYISKVFEVLDNDLSNDADKFFTLASSLPTAGVLSVEVGNTDIFYNQCFDIIDSDLEKIDDQATRDEIIRYTIDYLLDEKSHHKSELTDSEIKKLIDTANDMVNNKNKEILIVRIKEHNNKLKK